MKNYFILSSIFLSLLITDIYPQNISSIVGNDYVLRSCVSTVKLIRNHRKTVPRVDTLENTGKSITTDNSPNVNLIMNSRQQLNYNSRVERDRKNRLRGKITTDSPVKTVNIMRQRKSEPLLFRKKNGFPEVFQRAEQRRTKIKSEIITIKPVN
ncbi:GSCOCG00006689001-RA-CDS [Cotesia congregata]|nr:GSCOCG00006689001-RA-CDS [Cotesia congregata]